MPAILHPDEVVEKLPPRHVHEVDNGGADADSAAGAVGNDGQGAQGAQDFEVSNDV